MERLEHTIGYVFRDKNLLRQALTHPSFKPRPYPNVFQRLEFLGDRILGFIIAERLWTLYPFEEEGELSRRLTQLVRTEMLAFQAETIHLRHYLKTSSTLSSEDKSILADACEALIAAIYLDGGFTAVQHFIHTYWQDAFHESQHVIKDAKSQIQEWTQEKGYGIPLYKDLGNKGTAHLPIFRVEVEIPTVSLKAYAEARSKKEAQHQAAQSLLEQIEKLK